MFKVESLELKKTLNLSVVQHLAFKAFQRVSWTFRKTPQEGSANSHNTLYTVSQSLPTQTLRKLGVN